MSIWIVEYAYEGIGEAEAFTSAWTTSEKAQADANARADEQLTDMEAGGLEGLEITIVPSNKDKLYEVGIYDGDNLTEWWTVREVPLD